MKQILTFLFVVLSCGLSFSQETKKPDKLTLGTLFNLSYPELGSASLTNALRATYPVYKKLSLGAEVNYTQIYGPFVNSDAIGTVGFARIKFLKVFIAEVGYSYNEIISSARKAPKPVHGIFAATGFQVKAGEHFGIDFQYRFMPSRFNEWGVINSKIVMLGLSYSFK